MCFQVNESKHDVLLVAIVIAEILDELLARLATKFTITCMYNCIISIDIEEENLIP